MEENKSDISAEQRSLLNINFSIDGDALNDRVKDIDDLINNNKIKIIALLGDEGKLTRCLKLLNDSLNKENIN